ncbi:hypothetical protein O3G_MSEX014704 [Manduca sexta]|uniref:Uncharacterized protein n=1 Tax=Manduca sexta TaxID=7130 RepID=A0A922CZS9_MANSE|nr:hypothetical protein O3G_MSEX014704 [Manduca sexta]
MFKMIRLDYLLVILCITSFVVDANPIVLQDLTPSGSSVVAISSSGPNIENFAAKSTQDSSKDRGTVVQSVSVSSPGKTAAAGTGRSFASAYASSGNPFILPFLLPPGLDNFNLNNWIRSVESYYEPSYAGQGDNVVTAINDNGHIYGKVNGVPFDNGVKNSA